MMVILILRDDGRADDRAAFDQDAAGILRSHAVHVDGIWPAVEGYAPGVSTSLMAAELPDDPEVIAEVRAQLAECRARHGAEQVAWFVPEQIDTL
jgi:hypothetical protein